MLRIFDSVLRRQVQIIFEDEIFLELEMIFTLRNLKHFASKKGNASGKNGNEITNSQPTTSNLSMSNSTNGFSDRLTRCFVTSSHCCQTPKSKEQEECYENGANASHGNQITAGRKWHQNQSQCSSAGPQKSRENATGQKFPGPVSV